MVDIDLVAPNPYPLLTTITESNGYFSVLDLKDVFFCIPLEENSQQIFAFEWEGPLTGRRTQLCWTVLPQGFKNSLTIFGSTLAKKLEQGPGKENQTTLLQHVDDILLGAGTVETCKDRQPPEFSGNGWVLRVRRESTSHKTDCNRSWV